MLDLFLGSGCEGEDQCVVLAKGRNQHNLSVILTGQAHEFTPAFIKPFVESALYWAHFSDGKNE